MWGICPVLATTAHWPHHLFPTLPLIQWTTIDASTSLEDLLLDLWSTLIGPSMPSPWEILHSRTIQCPSKPSTTVDMEHIWDYMIAKKQDQKQYFDRAHNARELKKLDPNQEILFLSPIENAYIPRTIIDRTSSPHSYYIEAQGKRYCRTRVHIRPIQQDIFEYPILHLQTQLPKLSQNPKPSHIPKPSISVRAHLHTTSLSTHTKTKPLASTTNSCIPRPQQLRASQPNPHLCPITPMLHWLINSYIIVLPKWPFPKYIFPLEATSQPGTQAAQPITCTTLVDIIAVSPQSPSTATSSDLTPAPSDDETDTNSLMMTMTNSDPDHPKAESPTDQSGTTNDKESPMTLQGETTRGVTNDHWCRTTRGVTSKDGKLQIILN